MNFYRNSIKRYREPQMAKISKLAVGAYSRGGGLLTIFSSRVGAYSRGALSRRRANLRIYGTF